MTTDALDRQKLREPRPPPRLGFILAAFLELAVAVTFVSLLPDRRACLGLGLCAAYAHFSACASYVRLYLLGGDG